MEFVEGPNLAQVVRDNPLSAARAAGYVRIIAEAVHYAHERGILHRDLKPANVLLDPLDQPRVTDFGLAKNFAADPGLTEAGQVFGAPSFIPPEQAAGRTEEVGRRSDVYALGGILYYLLTGHPPFAAETPMATLARVLHHDPVPPRKLNASIPRGLESICLKCLEKQPKRRYSTAKDLADELGRFQRNEQHPEAVRGMVWHWCRRNPLLAGSFAAALLLLAGSIIAVSWQKRLPIVAQPEAVGLRPQAEKIPPQLNPGTRTSVGEIHDTIGKGDLKSDQARVKETLPPVIPTNQPPGSEVHDHAQNADQATLQPRTNETHPQVAQRIQSSSGEIHNAAQQGDLTTVQAMVKAAPDLVFSKDPYGYTPLHYAAAFGHTDIATFLLDNNAQASAAGTNGGTPLHAASWKGYADIVKLLLAHKADPNANAETGNTPLHVAAQWGQKDVVMLLLTGGAGLTNRNNYGETALHLAAAKGRHDVVELLLASNAPVDARDKNGASPLHDAAQNGHRADVELLLARKADVNATTETGYTPLHVAALNDHEDVVRCLLTANAEVNIRDINGLTPLRIAVAQGHDRVAELLRQHAGQKQ
jgi:ankyrin repeat protein